MALPASLPLAFLWLVRAFLVVSHRWSGLPGGGAALLSPKVTPADLYLPRGLQKDYSKDPRHGAEVTCWFVHNNGAGLIDGVYTDYIVPDIF